MEPKHLGQEGKFASNQTDFAPTQYYLARGLTIGNQEFKPETLLAVPIRDDEIFELLERLAATEDMFKTPVSTIRDVAELTDASPNLIARILGEMRGPGELEKIVHRLDEHEARLRITESKLSDKNEFSSAKVTLESRAKEGEDLILKDELAKFAEESYFEMLKKERNVPRYEAILDLPPGTKFLILVLLCVVVYYVAGVTGLRVERPPLPTTYELK